VKSSSRKMNKNQITFSNVTQKQKNLNCVVPWQNSLICTGTRKSQTGESGEAITNKWEGHVFVYVHECDIQIVPYI